MNVPGVELHVEHLDVSAEANVAAEFYHQCRLAGLVAYLEVPLASPIHRSRKFRVDCLVTDGKRVLCAVEFKRDGKSPTRYGTRQATAYNALSVPWRHCVGREHIAPLVAWAKSLRGRFV